MNWAQIRKRAVSCGLIFGGFGFYAHSWLRLSASYAVVAGPAIVIRAPADGVLTHGLRNFSVSESGAQIASIQPATVNDPVLRAATAELETVRAEVESLKEVISFSDEMRSKTATRRAALTSHRAEHLTRLLAQAKSDVEVKNAVKEGAEVVLTRSVKLCAEGLLGAQQCDDARNRAEIGEREVDSAKNQLGVAQFLLEASRSGVDIAQDLGAEVTYARQRQDDLTLQLASLRQQLETQTARAKALELRVHPPAAIVSVPSKSRIWRVLHQSGAQVVKGDPLFEVVDCSELFVFAAVTEHKYEKLRIGMPAQVTIDGRVRRGEVAQLLGPYGTFSQDRGMQPQPPVIMNGTDASNAGVAVEVKELTGLLGRNCEVGTRAEVTFER